MSLEVSAPCIAASSVEALRISVLQPVADSGTETSTSDTTFTYFQDQGNADAGDCPIGIYTTYSYL